MADPEDFFKKMSIDDQVLATYIIDFLPNLTNIVTGRSVIPSQHSNIEAMRKLKAVMTPTQAQRVAAYIRPKAPDLAELLWPTS